jgi:hypothetical protein
MSPEGTLDMQLKRSCHRGASNRAVALFLLALTLQAGSLAQASPAAASSPAASLEQPWHAGSRSNSIVTTLDALSDSAEALFSLAQAGKMERLRKNLDSLKKIAATIDNLQGKEALILLPRLRSTIDDLEKAVTGKNRLEIMRFANRITLIAATEAIPYAPDIPTELSLLDYNARELGIWSEVKLTDKLSSIVIRMHLAWQTLMPKLIEHHGEKELRRFSEIMGHLELAKNPDEYSRLSRQVLAEVDTMKAIFTRSLKGGKLLNALYASDSSLRRKPLPPKQGGSEFDGPPSRK